MIKLIKYWGVTKYYNSDIRSGKYENFDNIILNIKNIHITNDFNNAISKLDSINLRSNTWDYSSNVILDYNPLTKIINDLGTNVQINTVLNNYAFNQINKNYFSKEKTLYPKFYDNKIYKVNNEFVYVQNDLKNNIHNIAILTVARSWNFFYYFHPNRNLIDNEFYDSLGYFILEANKVEDLTQLYNLEYKILSYLKDGHVGLHINNEFIRRKYLPVQFDVDLTSNTIFISKIYNDSLARLHNLNLNDTILEINSIPAFDFVKNHSFMVSGSNFNIQTKNFVVFNLNCMWEDVSQMTTLHFNNKISHQLNYMRWNKNLNKIVSNFDFKEIKKNIIYAKCNIDSEVLISKIKSIDTLVIDCRNYPNRNWEKLYKYLYKEDKTIFTYKIPSRILIGKYRVIQDVIKGNHLENKSIMIFLITNQLSISQTETYIRAFCNHKNVKLVGEETSGTNGDVKLFTFPDGNITYFSSIGWYDSNDLNLQGISLQPNIKFSTTQLDDSNIYHFISK